MLSLVVSIRLVLTSLVITPQQLDESIRAIASAPLRNAAVSIAVGAWMGKQVTEAVSYRRRLAVLVLFIMPVAITTRWAGALRSGNYSAVDPAFMLTCFASKSRDAARPFDPMPPLLRPPGTGTFRLRARPGSARASVSNCPQHVFVLSR